MGKQFCLVQTVDIVNEKEVYNKKETKGANSLRNQDCIEGVDFGLRCKEIFGLLVTVDLVPCPKCAAWCQITKLLASFL